MYCKTIDFKMNINTMEQNLDDKTIKMNDIAQISIKTTKALFYDAYK